MSGREKTFIFELRRVESAGDDLGGGDWNIWRIYTSNIDENSDHYVVASQAPNTTQTATYPLMPILRFESIC